MFAITAMIEIGKTLIIIGGLITVVGFLILFFGKLPFLGKLPGDILIKKDGFTFYFPLTTSIIVSLIISILIKLFGK